MKNYIKFLGIISMAAVIALAFTACPIGPEPVPPEPEHVHQWGAWTVTTAATCETAGEETRVCALDSSHRETRTGAAALGHDWNEWGTPAAATVTEDGFKARICKRDNTHTETAFSGEYATGTPGLAYEPIGSPATAYRVRKGTVTSGVVHMHIPAFHRPDANSPYLPVTEIGGNINDISLPITMPSEEFRNTSITTVTFAQNSQLKTINASTFSYCTSLTSITLPASVTSIGDSAFIACTGLTSITIPASVISIGFQAFRWTGLTSVTIPAGVTSIGNNAFFSCQSLTAITVASANPNYSSDSGILYNKAKTTLIQAPGAISGNITILSSVTSIGVQMFDNCTSLTSITIPASVTSIGGSAFSGCTSLTSVTFAGAIASASFNSNATTFPGDLRTKFYATDSANGTPGTYTRPNTTSSTWTRQP